VIESDADIGEKDSFPSGTSFAVFSFLMSNVVLTRSEENSDLLVLIAIRMPNLSLISKKY
jgi:hypothetical protein